MEIRHFFVFLCDYMKKSNKKSALQEISGINEPDRLNKKITGSLKSKRKLPDVNLLVDKILSGDKIYLSKAITLIESTHPKHYLLGQEVIKKCLPQSGNSVRIGITGVPGVGKSTFIERLGKYYTSQGHKVAVLAIDPSSSLSKGSILGDKTRMESLSRDKNAYIRPSASGNHLGGVARKTRETILLCEAAGFDKIIIETVGVGQSETIAHSMVDFFLLLKLAGAGDELQGIKRGIIEMADLIVINKAEKENINSAKLAQKAFENALHFYPPKDNGWIPKVLLASALLNKGINNIARSIDSYIQLTKQKGFFEKKRKEQDVYWFKETVNREILEKFYRQTQVQKLFEKFVQEINTNKITAFEAAEKLLKFNP